MIEEHPDTRRKAVFIDKDGTLIEDVPFNVDVRHIKLREHAISALCRLHVAGYAIIIVTNQSGIAHGMFEPADVELVGEYLRRVLAAAGIPLTGFHYCPHHMGGSVRQFSRACDCRKPAPGLLLEAARVHDIDLHRSWMVGDILHDIEAGNQAGCRTILLDVGSETEWEFSKERWPDHQTHTLSEVADIILGTGVTSAPGDEATITLPAPS